MVRLEVLLLLVLAHPGLEGLAGVDACRILQAECCCPGPPCSLEFDATLRGRRYVCCWQQRHFIA